MRTIADSTGKNTVDAKDEEFCGLALYKKVFRFVHRYTEKFKKIKLLKCYNSQFYNL